MLKDLLASLELPVFKVSPDHRDHPVSPDLQGLWVLKVHKDPPESRVQQARKASRALPVR